jgi:hypothetical protein
MKLALTFCIYMLIATSSFASEAIEHKRLYTKPDPQAPGGLKGSIVSPDTRIRQILAIPRSKQNHAYRGELDSSRRNFHFKGLPMDIYDLVVIFDTRVYEGIRLSREDSTLTSQDLEQINDILQRSEPFFTIKHIHRVQGQTGRGNQSMAFVTFARDRKARMYEGPVVRDGYRRTHKLVTLKQVGPGWQVERTRDLFPIWIEDNEKHLFVLKHDFSSQLAGIRITNSIRDMGALSL